MSSLADLYGRNAKNNTLTSNFGVDYVIQYTVPAKERAEAEAGFVRLVENLTRVGLATEVRHGTKESLLIFIKVASDDYLSQQVYRARLQDWLVGVRTSSPDKDVSKSLKEQPVSEAERLRLVYFIITKSKNEGGAGITPGKGQWKYVASIFPLHDHGFNRTWIQKLSGKYLVEQSDIDEIRDKFGESVAFYFAFIHSYIRFQVFPAAAGFAFWLLMGQFSYTYALLNCMWSVVFFEWWKKKEVDLAVQWGVRGVSRIQLQRPEYQWEYEGEDPVTGEPVKIYPPLKRLQTQLLLAPFALACVVVLGGLIVTCNSLEIFINEYYDGPGKQYLAFVPTIILVIFTPTFSSFLMKAAEALTVRENYATMDAYKAALIQKQFILNFLTSYMPLFFTAFVYIPFGNILVPYLEFWKKTAQVISFSEKPLATRQFEVNPRRISNQMFYFTVTAQIVNFATEVVVPYVKREALAKAKELQSGDTVNAKDHPEEAEFLERIRHEAELQAYDVSDDYREMAMQFGYLSLFSVAWPLTACCFLINNWIELRSDALKIAISSRRPIPWRSDSIGPWLTSIGFLSWLGSITSSAIVFLCHGSGNGSHGTTSNITTSGLLLSIFFAEHLYLAAQWSARFVLSKIDSPGLQQERRERYMMKRQMLDEELGQEVAEKASVPGVVESEKITRAALEEEARESSIQGHGGPEKQFWQRQRSMQETIEVGRNMMEQIGADEAKSSSSHPSPRG